MRTTLTLDDDLAQILKQRAVEAKRPFKEIVNLILRKGLEENGAALPRPNVNTIPIAGGLRPGIDSEKMNQIADQLEVDAVVEKLKKEEARG